jgi:sugar lactone lactonase YvrE
MNDLVVIGRDKFYITMLLHYRDKPMRTVEYMTQSAWGAVLYYDGKKARAVIPSGLFMPNGINISPDQK